MSERFDEMHAASEPLARVLARAPYPIGPATYTAACGLQQAQPNMAPIRRDSCDNNDNQEAEEGDLRYLNSDI